MARDVLGFSPGQERVVEYFRRNFVKDLEGFVAAIHGRCQMYGHGIDEPERDPGATFAYFDCGLKMLYP
jgi:hypothetical protein